MFAVLKSMHAVEDGWCEWVNPKRKGYLLGCCDCGLVHEMEFEVMRFESADSEVGEVVEDPTLGVIFRAKRHTQRCEPAEKVLMTREFVVLQPIASAQTPESASLGSPTPPAAHAPASGAYPSDAEASKELRALQVIDAGYELAEAMKQAGDDEKARGRAADAFGYRVHAALASEPDAELSSTERDSTAPRSAPAA